MTGTKILQPYRQLTIFLSFLKKPKPVAITMVGPNLTTSNFDNEH